MNIFVCIIRNSFRLLFHCVSFVCYYQSWKAELFLTHTQQTCACLSTYFLYQIFSLAWLYISFVWDAGNPRVTPEVTRDVCLLARMMAANLYYSQIEDLMFEVLDICILLFSLTSFIFLTEELFLVCSLYTVYLSMFHLLSFWAVVYVALQ